MYSILLPQLYCSTVLKIKIPVFEQICIQYNIGTTFESLTGESETGTQFFCDFDTD